MQHLTTIAPQCLLYSAAMVLDLSVEALVSIIGHDGMAISDPNRVDNSRYRGIHIQEVQYAALSMNRHFYPIEAIPSSTNGQIINSLPFDAYIQGQRAILIGLTSNSNEHAVAWNDDRIYDPRPSGGDVYIREAWILSM